MADISALFATLAAANQQSEAESPYRRFGSVADQLSDAVVSSGPRFSTKDKVIAGLVTGLLGGVSDVFGDRRQAANQQAALDVLNASIAGNSVLRPSGMSQNVFGGVQNAGVLFGLQQREEQAKLKQAAQQAIELKRVEQAGQQANTLLGAVADKPWLKNEILSAAGLAPDAPAPASDVVPTQATKPTTNFIENVKRYKDEGLARSLTEKAVADEQLTAAGLGSLAGVPTGLQGDIVEQQGALKKKTQMSEMIDTYFDQAAQLSSLKAAIPYTQDNKTLAGLQSGLVDVLQNLRPNEISDASRRNYEAKFTPQLSDSAEELERKRAQFHALAEGMTKPTALAETATPATPSAVYSVEQLNAAGYSARDIAALQAKGLVK